MGSEKKEDTMDDYNILTFWIFVAVCAILIVRIVWRALRPQEYPKPPGKHAGIRDSLLRSFIYLFNAGHGAGLP